MEKYLFPSIFQKNEESRTAGRTTFVHCNLKERKRETERDGKVYRFDVIGCDWGSNASQLDLIGTNNYSLPSKNAVGKKARFQRSSWWYERIYSHHPFIASLLLRAQTYFRQWQRPFTPRRHHRGSSIYIWLYDLGLVTVKPRFSFFKDRLFFKEGPIFQRGHFKRFIRVSWYYLNLETLYKD